MLSSFYEINFDRYFSSDELALSIAQIFGVAPSQVLVLTGSADDYLTKDILILVTVIQVEGGGEFPVSLDVGQKNGFYDHFQQRETIELLCETLHCRALLTSESIDPNVFFEISGIGKSCLVYVDPEKRKQGIYVIREYL